MASQALGVASFFEKIFKELYQSVYVALGGSIEDQTYDWANRGLAFLSVAIKIAILLIVIGFLYWILVYLLKRSKKIFNLSERTGKVSRSVLRYLWLM
ncbi:MAG: mechanosensitive ion channel family protein, partial [Moraxella sp.]|nr:mechanosensitive ion channel family protein [Moraxella sp.]